MELTINLEIEKENGDLYEPECFIQFENYPYRRATYWEPEEGGVEIECIVIAGVNCYDNADLQRAKVDTYGADYARIIDAYVQDIGDYLDSNFGRCD